MNRKQKIGKIKKLFYKLYCFKSEEIESFINKLPAFPEKGLDDLLRTLEEGKTKQDELLKKTIEKDKKFNKKLNGYLKKTSKKIKDDYEQKERAGAEKIIENL